MGSVINIAMKANGKPSRYNLRDIVTPKSGLVVYTNAYWWCKNGDPKQALFFNDSPQCNQNKRILEWSGGRDLYKGVEGLEIVHVPVAYVPQRL